MSQTHGLGKLGPWVPPWPRGSSFRGLSRGSELAGGGVAKSPFGEPYLLVGRACGQTPGTVGGEWAGPAPGGAARRHSAGRGRWIFCPTLRATWVCSSAGYPCRGFFIRFVFGIRFNGVAPMTVDEDWADGASVESWLAVVPFDGVRKDTAARWRRVLGTIMKYARRIPSGVLRCVSCYCLEFSCCRGNSLFTVGDLKADTTFCNLKGKCALVRLGLLRLAREDTLCLDADVADAYPFFENAMQKLREPRVPAAAVVAPEAAAQSTATVEDPLEAWVRCMISADHVEMADDTRNPRKTIKAIVLATLRSMCDRMLCLDPILPLRTWMPPPPPPPSWSLASRRGFFVHAGVSTTC